MKRHVEQLATIRSATTVRRSASRRCRLQRHADDLDMMRRNRVQEEGALEVQRASPQPCPRQARELKKRTGYAFSFCRSQQEFAPWHSSDARPHPALVPHVGLAGHHSAVISVYLARRRTKSGHFSPLAPTGSCRAAFWRPFSPSLLSVVPAPHAGAAQACGISLRLQRLR